MLILDQGYWYGYSCLDRGWHLVLWALVAWCFIGFTIFLRLKFDAFFHPRLRFPSGKILSDNHEVRRILPISGLTLVVIISLVSSLIKTRSELFLDGGFVVETGCKALRAYENRWDRTFVQTEYLYSETDGEHGKRHEDRLKIRNVDEGLAIYVDLSASNDLEGLVALAPDAMRQYSDNLAATRRGANQKLKDLLNQNR